MNTNDDFILFYFIFMIMDITDRKDFKGTTSSAVTVGPVASSNGVLT